MSGKRTKRRKARAPAVRTASARPLLSLAMMVKDEEDFIADAIKSARGFCDELVVVDTGSTDRTVEIARDLGATVSFFPWCDSFSKARNETLRRSTGQYIAVLDADERFAGANPERVRRLLVPGPQHPYEAISLEVLNTRLDGTPMSSFYSVRLFANDARLGYQGRVHNRFGAMEADAPKVLVTPYADLKVVHLGYDPALYAARKKAERSLPLIEATVREAPDDHQQRYYLGREYLLLGRVPEAVSTLRRAVEGVVASGAGPLVEASMHLMQALTRAAAPPAEALAVGRQALAQHPEHPDLWFEVGRALARAEQMEAAVQALERALLLLDRPQVAAQVQLAHRRYEAHELLGRLYWALGRYREAYQHDLATLPDKPADSPGWSVLLNSACALAIELGDRARVPGLLDRLLAHPEAPLGMFFFELDRVASREGPDAARALLVAARARCPRLVADAEYAPRAARLGVS